MDEYENEFSLQASPGSVEHSITSLYSSGQSQVSHSFAALHALQQQTHQADNLNALKRMPWQNTDLTTYFTKVDQGHMSNTTTTNSTTLVYRDDSSRDSGISSLDSYSATAFGSSTRMNETAKMPTDFSPLAMELGNQHGPTNGSLAFQECSPATACESETDIVLSSKMGGTFSLLNTEKDNSDYLPRLGHREPPKAQPAKRIAHNTTPYPPTYARQISAPLSKRPLQLRDITNTNVHADVSPTARFFKKSQDGGPLAKLSRKRSSALEEETKKRRKSNEQMFLHDHEGIPMSVRSMPRVHSSSVLESSFDRMKNNPNSYHSPDPLEHYSLKTVEKPQTASAAFRSISADTLCRLLDSMTEEQFRKKFFLVDCRYPFEFSGGHIRNAVNIFDPIHIEATFYPSKQEDFRDINSRIPIFYCEFSQKRGPQMAHELRKIDRMHNEKHYPHVDYKEIYILDYGYNKFFDKAKLIDFCEPQYSFHKKATMFSTDLKGNGKYFNGRKMSAHSRYSGSVRRQMSLGNRSISDFEANYSSSSSSFSISDSPVSSTSVQAVSSGCSAANSSIHLPIQRLARMTMQSPSSPAFHSQPGKLAESTFQLFQSRRMLFGAICEESCSSSSASSSASSSPPPPLPKPAFSPKYS
uniref:M-phase inducer phosphatase n=1 Tax=Ditylenchus dipsaci TaxID=166011 RepID=A0A915E806_9BILA